MYSVVFLSSETPVLHAYSFSLLPRCGTTFRKCGLFNVLPFVVSVIKLVSPEATLRAACSGCALFCFTFVTRLLIAFRALSTHLVACCRSLWADQTCFQIFTLKWCSGKRKFYFIWMFAYATATWYSTCILFVRQFKTFGALGYGTCYLRTVQTRSI